MLRKEWRSKYKPAYAASERTLTEKTSTFIILIKLLPLIHSFMVLLKLMEINIKALCLNSYTHTVCRCFSSSPVPLNSFVRQQGTFYRNSGYLRRICNACELSCNHSNCVQHYGNQRSQLCALQDTSSAGPGVLGMRAPWISSQRFRWRCMRWLYELTSKTRCQND